MSETGQIYTLEDGTQINKFCLSQLDDLLMNQETIWDVLDVVTKLTRLEVTKDENGFVKDVEIIIPHANEVIAKFALKTFVKVHEERGDTMSPETVLELRRHRLEKFINKGLK